jgi:hypothetical protein
VLAVLLALAVVPAAHAQGLRVFTDSPRLEYWDPSWGQYTGASRVELKDVSHFPVDTAYHRSGTNALRLAWISAPGGDWALCAATSGWSAGSLDGLDSLLFWILPATAFPPSELPLVFLEDASNVRTGKRSLGLSVSALTPGAWQRVALPIDFFRANPNGADLTRINKVFFGQDPASSPNVSRVLRIDDIRFTAADVVPPPPPAAPAARAGERHVDVTWSVPADPDHETIRVERFDGAQWDTAGWAAPEDGAWPDWLGAPGLDATYRLVACDWAFNESAPVAAGSATTRAMADHEMLDLVQEATFRYFWNHAHPVSGLARERYGSGDICATGGTGFGLMAILAAIERGFITRAEGLARVTQIAEFYANDVERFHGAFAHWVHGVTGAHVPFNGPGDDTADIVETAYLAEGLLAARGYFDGADPTEAHLRDVATQVWEGIEWDAFRPAGSAAIWWHRSPTTGFANSMPVTGWNECMIVYLLAVASPTHPVPPSAYHDGWAQGGAILNGGTFYGHVLDVGWDWGGPLFFAHYSFLGFDPRFKRDAYANYYTHNRSHALVNHDYCVANPLGRVGYGPDAWGLTASDNPWGYAAHEPWGGDNGTLTPTAALSSMPYVPQEAMAALRGFYTNHGERLWGPFGFRDALNPGEDWVASSYIAIDQGPIVGMIENHRSGRLWSAFMSNPEIAPMLAALGFVADSSAVTGSPGPAAGRAALRLAPAPNPSRAELALLIDLPARTEAEIDVFDLEGRRVASPFRGTLDAGRHRVSWDGRDAAGRALSPGLYHARLLAGGASTLARIVRLGR